MPALAPIYTADNCRAAFQLNWVVTVFWSSPVEAADWLTPLQQVTERDGVRLLQHRFLRPGTSQFLASTKPDIAPVQVVRTIEGRLQYLVRAAYPRPFRRHYALRSVGSATRETIEQYVQSQMQHHPMADPRVQQRLERLQIHRPDVDLSQRRRTAHAVYWYDLHVVFVHDCRYMQVREDVLRKMNDMILKAAGKRGHLLSDAGIVPDHVHLTLGCNIEETPQDVALSYMNNLAYTLGMKPVFAFGFYVGTFGEYDLGVTF